MGVREKLVEFIDDFIYNVDLKHWYSEELDEKLATHLIANGVTVQEWVSVKDRLPRKEEYIATAEDGTEYYVRLLVAYKTDTVEYEIGYYDGYKWMTETPIRLIKDVVAWMPFPNMLKLSKGK